MSLTDRVVFITGASRGVGKACALACAAQGANVVIAAKSSEPHPTLPGTIHETADAVRALGRKALAIKLDVRDADACAEAVAETVQTFGRIDAVVNNAGALFWADVHKTPVKRFDLMMGVNVRAAFSLSQAALPHMMQARYGHIVMMSPPVDTNACAHHGAYAVSKFGMTLLAHAIAGEYRDQNIAAHAVWPATLIESSATEVYLSGINRSLWRKADILADAVVALLKKEPSARTGGAYIDEALLRSEGVQDFTRYRLDPAVEPPHFSFKDIPPISG